MFDYIPGPDETHADDWIQGWYKSLAVNPDKVVYADTSEDLTKEQVEQISGRLYGYLKAHNIGREDVVMVYLPRGARALAACLGVLKAGAAFCIVEQGYPIERIDIMRAEVHFALELTPELFSEICNGDFYLRGFEHADDHDAAYIVYTSGSTGRPRGVIQERGSLYMSFLSCLDDGEATDYYSQLGLMAPLGWSSALLTYAALGNLGGLIYVLDYETIRNPVAFLTALATREIRCIFMAVPLLRALADKLPPTLETVIVGATPADRVWAGPGRRTLNYYMSTETCFVISKYDITAPVDNPPVGRPADGIEAWIGDEGEVTVRTPFFRGYIEEDASEELQSYVCDGVYHSSDLAYLDAEGNFVLRGRKPDMLEIDGERIEPAKIEAAFRIATKLECVARGFQEGDSGFVALYYVAPADVCELDVEAVRQELANTLPSHMVPAYIVPIQALPLSPHGKLMRTLLPRPER